MVADAVIAGAVGVALGMIGVVAASFPADTVRAVNAAGALTVVG